MATDSRTALVTLKSAAQLERAAERSRAEELLAHVERNMGLITDAFFEIGAALTQLLNNRLYLALGYQTFAELLEQRHLMSQAQANKLIAVATLMPREAAVKLGAEKSYALTRYVQAASPTGGLARVLEAGRVKGRPLESLTVRQLTELTREIRGPRPTQGSDALLEARRLARQAQATLRKRGLASLRAEATGSRGASFRLTLTADELQVLLNRV